MRCIRTRRTAFVAALLAIGCGGKAQESAAEQSDGNGSSAGSAGTGLEVCDQMRLAADQALQTLVETNNSCDTDGECASLAGVGECFTYCSVPILNSSTEAASTAAREICRPFVEQGCGMDFACPNYPGAACRSGRCAFEF